MFLAVKKDENQDVRVPRRRPPAPLLDPQIRLSM